MFMAKVHLTKEFRDLLILFRDNVDDLLVADSDPNGFAHRCDTFSPILKDFYRFMLVRKDNEIFYEI